MVALTYLGHAAFLLEGDGHTIVIDPFLTGNPTAARSPDTINPETILLTHAHDDHMGDTIPIAKRTGATVITINEIGKWLPSQGVSNAIGAGHGGTVSFPGGTVKLVPAWHTSSYGDDIAVPSVPAGMVVRFGGKTIYFAGDTCLFSDMQLIGDEGLDLAVIPIGDHFTMGPADAVRAVKFLRPKQVVPCHYNTYPLLKQDPHAFKREVEAQTDAKCTVLDPGEALQL